MSSTDDRIRRLEAALKDVCRLLKTLNKNNISGLMLTTQELYNELVDSDAKASAKMNALSKLNFDDMVALGVIDPNKAGKFVSIASRQMLAVILCDLAAQLEVDPLGSMPRGLSCDKVYTFDRHVAACERKDARVNYVSVDGHHCSTTCDLTITPLVSYGPSMMTVAVHVKFK